MLMNEFVRYLLTPEGMAEGRAAVVGRWEWFTHGAPQSAFAEIKAKGIEPRWPDGSFDIPELIDARGKTGQAIVCLSPIPKTRTIPICKNEWAFVMAVHRDDLPQEIGIDCTFGGTYEQAARWRTQHPGASAGDIFAESVRDREVVVSFVTIRPEIVRVCPKAQRDAPFQDWPRIVDVELADVALFGPPDLMGCVRI
jgi:hypothetical protein